ncbi:MAG: immunoglobulin domain-containing protein, partial [Verrucomicrobiae bacterium]|nr:immunoglobulin domain-containing protein [Verrucomicrobiae bacterium]
MPLPAPMRRRWAGPTALAIAALVALVAPAANAGTFKTIRIDGSFGDWAGVPVAYEDPADSTESADYRRIYLANDDEYLYLRFTLEQPANPFLSNANLFLDTDANPDTGFRVLLGSELLVQGGVGYDERNGGFNEGGVNDLGWLSAPGGEATEFEVRIARAATYAGDGAGVFTGDTIALLLEAEDTNYARKETAPDFEGLVYTFAPAPPLLTAPVTLAALTGTSWRVNDSGTDLGTAWREPEFDDSAAPWREGSGLFGYTDAPGAYPAAIATPLATTAGTAYLRTTFAWDSNPANLVFAISNLLSDGAVFYLNGAEVRRVRLPSGEVTFATPATGGPAAAGQVEVFGISGAPLVSGDNVLAVELHQATGTLADLVFGLSLTATPEFSVQWVDTAEPADQTAVAGDVVTLTAEVLGTPPLTYQWRKDGAPIDGANGPSLTFDPVLKTDEGRYTLTVSNPGGSATTREAQLSVTVTPASITDANLPADVTVFEGGSAAFEVSVAGSPPLSFQWLKDGFPIEGATAATYTI